jgi:hypothetical protein
MQGEGDFVEDARVLVVGDEALADGAIGVADVEPDPVAAVSEKTAPLQHNVTTERQLVAARLPAPVKAFGVVVFHHAVGQ